MSAFTGYKALDFSGIDKAIQGFQQRQQLASLGQNLDGTPEGYAKAAQALLQKGDTAAAANFFALGEKARERLLTETATKNSPFAINRPTPTAPTVQGVAPVTSLGATSGAGRASPAGVAVAETPDAVASLEAQSSGLTQLGNWNEPRGLRNNNPGNIESGRFAATVQGFQGSDGRFAQYATPEQGIQAADKLLTSYAGRGLNTVNGIVNRWAPPTENNTGAYVAQVAKELGVDPNQPLDMNNWEVRQKLIAAKIRVENGKQPYAEDVFQRALNPNWGREVAAFEGGAQPSQTAQAGPQFALGSAPPPSDQFTPAQQPSQVARAPQGAPAQDGLYTSTPTPALQAFINNPRVPDNLRTLMQQELAKRGGGAPAAPVQLAQAPAQPGAPVSDVPAQGGAEVQGNFTIPGPNQLPPNDPRPDISTRELLEVLNDKRQSQYHAAALEIYRARQKYSDENAPEKRALTKAQAEKAQLELEQLRRSSGGYRNLVSPEERASAGIPADDKRVYQLGPDGKLYTPPGGTTVNVGAGETEESKAIGKAAGTRASETMAAAASASKQLMRLGQIDALMKNVETGKLSPSRMTIAALGKSLGVDDAYLEALGLDPKRVGDAQALNAISGRMLVDMIGSGGFPANNFSNTDREFLTGTLPSLANDPRANKLLITAARRMADLDIEKAKGWRTWKRENPKGSFDDFELEFADKIGGADRFADLVKEAEKLGAAPPPPPPAPTKAVDHLRANPSLRSAFDAKYGPGSAARILGE